MKKSEKIKIGFLSALLPIGILIVLITAIVFVFRYISGMGQSEIARKAEHYAQLADVTPKNATVFLGDSITELARVDESVIALQPGNLVMLMGVNDLNQGVALDEIVGNIGSIVKKVKEKSPDTNIVLQAVYPIDPDRDSFYERNQLGDRDNETIRCLNEKLEALAKKEEINFLDVTHILADENGDLKKEYTFDGLHPNVDGYLSVRDEIIKMLVAH